MTLTEVIQKSWGWTGLKPSAIIDENDFGNIIVKDEEGAFWRICPEELSCERVASTPNDMDTLWQDLNFLTDWNMEKLVQLALSEHGALTETQKYCLKLPAILGGSYQADNLGILSFAKQISFSGTLALQIRDLPDGTQIEIDFGS